MLRILIVTQDTVLSTIAQLPPLARRNINLMFTAGLLFWACMGSMLPTLAVYIKQGGATDGQVGWVMGAFAVGLLLSRPTLGKIADRRGRKIVVLIGISVAAIAPLLYIPVQHSPLLMSAVRIFHGLSIAAFTTGFSALVADLAPPQNRGEVIGHMSLANPIGMAIGPALGGFLQPQFGDARLFQTATALAIVSLMFALRVRPPAIAPGTSAPPSANSAPNAAPIGPDVSTWQMLRSDRLRIPSLTMLMVGLAFGLLSTYMPLYVQQLNLDMNAGWFYSMAAVASFSTRLFAGKASDRLGRGRFITLGLACYAVAMVLLWQARSVPWFLAAGFAEGLGGGVVMPVMVALVADRCAPHERGRVFSLCIGGFDLGIALAGPLLGSVAHDYGYATLFGLASMIMLTSIAMFTTLSSKDLIHSLRFALGPGRDLYALPKGTPVLD
jgi:MFS family permease